MWEKKKQEQLIAAVDAFSQYIRAHEISDFRIQKLEHDTLRLVGSFDLSYYHDIEITITGILRLNLYSDFYVDLSEPSPFSLRFPSEEAAVLRFRDCGASQQGEIHFDGDISFCTEHVSYHSYQ